MPVLSRRLARLIASTGFVFMALLTPVPSGSAAPSRLASARPTAAVPESVVVLDTAVGLIAIELFPADAPRTVANFRKLVSERFYDGLTFHRVAPGFVIQGGDPNSRDENPFNDGQGGPGYTLPAEIKRAHVHGAVAMARRADSENPARESSGSQFYIALRDLPQLDGAYTVFGQVLTGWNTVDSLVALSERRDIARQGNNSNPGRLALIRRARLEPAARWRARAREAARTHSAR